MKQFLKYVRSGAIIVALLVVMVVASQLWKRQIIRDYEAQIQAQIQGKQKDEQKAINDIFGTGNDAINANIERMLADYAARLQHAKCNPQYADQFSEGNTDMGAQNELRYLRTDEAEVPEILCSVEQVIECKPKECCN